MPAARTALAVATRVLLTLVVVAVMLAVAALMAAWWVLCALLWFRCCAGRGCSTGRLGANSAWRRPPWARRVQPGRHAGLF